MEVTEQYIDQGERIEFVLKVVGLSRSSFYYTPKLTSNYDPLFIVFTDMRKIGAAIGKEAIGWQGQYHWCYDLFVY